MTAPLPPGWTTADFNTWFAPIYAHATSRRTTYVQKRATLDLLPNVLEWQATGATTSPLPPGWSMQEFTDWMTALTAEATAWYYAYILSETPDYLQANVKERINYGLPVQASILISFMGASMPAGTSDARASAGWATGSTGVLTSYANDVPRFRYAPITLSLDGLLDEPAATNVVRNASMTGAVAGTPGTTPTNWVVNSTSNGVTRTVVGTGTEDGLPYIDLKFTGTPSASNSMIIRPEPVSTIPALPGQTWVSSFWHRLMAGSLANAPVSCLLTTRTSGGATISSTTAVLTPTAAALRTQRTNLLQTAPATAAFVDLDTRIAYTSGQPIDITLRVGLPQLVVATAPTSPIVTTAGAVARAADVVAVVPPGAVAGFWDVVVTRLSGDTSTLGQDFTAGVSYTVPVDPSPLRSVRFNWP